MRSFFAYDKVIFVILRLSKKIMRRSVPGFAVLIISGFCLLLNSCLEVPCIDETEAYVKANFYNYSTSKAIIPDSLTLYGIGMETYKIYDSVKISPPALFPLRDSTDYSTFVIRINGVTDTIYLRYSSYPHLISKECGYTFYHYIDTIYYTRHSIDSISKKSENVTTVNGENIGIYY
jgi:hypothetical protein